MSRGDWRSGPGGRGHGSERGTVTRGWRLASDCGGGGRWTEGWARSAFSCRDRDMLLRSRRHCGSWQALEFVPLGEVLVRGPRLAGCRPPPLAFPRSRAGANGFDPSLRLGLRPGDWAECPFVGVRTIPPKLEFGFGKWGMFPPSNGVTCAGNRNGARSTGAGGSGKKYKKNCGRKGRQLGEVEAD